MPNPLSLKKWIMAGLDRLVLYGWLNFALMTEIQGVYWEIYRGNSTLREEPYETMLLTKGC